MAKLKNPSYDKTQKLKLWQNSKTQIVTTQELKLGKNSNCDKTHKLKLGQNSKS